jgi:hypothetical protein
VHRFHDLEFAFHPCESFILREEHQKCRQGHSTRSLYLRLDFARSQSHLKQIDRRFDIRVTDLKDSTSASQARSGFVNLGETFVTLDVIDSLKKDTVGLHEFRCWRLPVLSFLRLARTLTEGTYLELRINAAGCSGTKVQYDIERSEKG